MNLEDRARFQRPALTARKVRTDLRALTCPARRISKLLDAAFQKALVNRPISILNIPKLRPEALRRMAAGETLEVAVAGAVAMYTEQVQP